MRYRTIYIDKKLVFKQEIIEKYASGFLNPLVLLGKIILDIRPESDIWITEDGEIIERK